MRTLKNKMILVMTSLVLCISLTGCSWITSLRERQVTITQEGNFLVNGVTYLPLPEVTYINDEYDYWDKESVVLAEEEVPLLLTTIIGEVIEMSDDKLLLRAFDEEYNNQYYCRADRYDELLEVIEGGYQPDGYCISYYDWDADEDKTYLFSKEEMDAVQTVVAKGPASPNYKEYLHSVSVSSYMENLPFEEYEFDVVETEKGYFLEFYDMESEMSVYYKIPAELKAIFKQIMETCCEDYYWDE